jgi:nicotinate-nucleotide adenylyltransferase
MKAGIFGGTFNPVHLGHLRMAEEVREHFGLDKIYFIPAARPPHKTDHGLAPATDRYAMLNDATAGNPCFETSDLELQRSGRSYTIDTVDQIFSMLPEDSRCFLIMGMDAFMEIETWKYFQKLFNRIEVIVISRPVWHKRIDGEKDQIKVMEDIILGKISEKYRYDPGLKCFAHPDMKTIYRFGATSLDISATRIRSLVAGQKSIRYLVPEIIESYIYKKRLYL